jgi:6-pyruvoyltetrahydropterin/6-carboxytetrahydropterin synthase
MPYRITKTFGHERGLSCCFRQWRAESHCRFLHGYALAVEFTIEAKSLNPQNWVFDFGDFKEIKEWLEEKFDHKLIVAEDDPLLPLYKGNFTGEFKDFADMVIMEKVGCEAFAHYIFNHCANIIGRATRLRARLVAVKVSEHGANSATYNEPI